jgi:transcriptional regulator with XRE-family HTH domain
MKSKHEFQKNLGANLRRIRNNCSWSIEKLALESGLTYSQIGRIELGKRNPSCFTMYQISKTLKVSITEFLENNMETSNHSNREYSENPKE